MPTGIIFVSITFIEGIPIKGKEQIFLKPGFNLHSEDSVMALKKWSIDSKSGCLISLSTQ